MTISVIKAGLITDLREIEVSTSSQEIRTSPEEITYLACKILETTHSLKDFTHLYEDPEDPELMIGFITNRHENNPSLSKMQQRINALKTQVAELKTRDVSIEALFNQMIEVGINSKTRTEGLESFETATYAIIGEEKILDAGPFKKHGVICLKDKYLPLTRVQNIVSENELSEMKTLRSILFNPEERIINIDDFNPMFVQKIQNYFEKILTLENGREMIRKLCSYKSRLRISNLGENSCFKPSQNTLFLIPSSSMAIGITDNKTHVSIPMEGWLSLGHELIHALHYYSKEIPNSCCDNKINCNWTNMEEYLTIGDPTKNINPISENGFRQHTLHLLRRFHVGGISKKSDLEKRIKVCASAGIDGDLIEIMLRHTLTKEQVQLIFKSCCCIWSSSLAMELLDHVIGKEVLKESLYPFFLTATVNEDKDVLEKIINEFSEECKKFSEHKNTSLFLSLLKWNPNLLMRFFNENASSEESALSESHFHNIITILIENWSLTLAVELLNHDLGKVAIKAKLYPFFLAATANNDTATLEKIKEDFPDTFNTLSENKNTPLFLNLITWNPNFLLNMLASHPLSEEINLTETHILNIITELLGNWSFTLAMDLLNHDLGKVVIKEEFYPFYIAARVSDDTNALKRIPEEFPDECKINAGNKNTALLLTLNSLDPAYTMEILREIANSSENTLSEGHITGIGNRLKARWNPPLALELFNHDLGKKEIRNTFSSFFISASENKDDDILKRIFEESPHFFKHLNEKHFVTAMVCIPNFIEILIEKEYLHSFYKKAVLSKLSLLNRKKDIKSIRAMIHFKDFFDITTEDLLKFQENTKLDPEIQELFPTRQ